MTLSLTPLLLIYSAIIASLVWARYFYFSLNSSASKRASVLYDVAVAVQIFVTYYYFFVTTSIELEIVAIAFLIYTIAVILFWWSIKTSGKFDFAFSSNVGNLITTGPFRIVRHPFYVSYIIVWATSTVLFMSPALWITFCFLLVFYATSAKKEEMVLTQSKFSNEYKKYRNNVGMFFPGATQWKSWISKFFQVI